jgi:hypothetical protein
MQLAKLFSGRRVFVLSGCLLLLASLFTTGRASAQSSTGAIAGTVTDPNGLAVSGAKVLIHSADTGLDQSLTTNEAGSYVAPYLQPGNYVVTGTMTGFQTVASQTIAVHVGDKITFDLQMPLGTQTTSVTVTEEVPLIETEKTSSSQTVDQGLVSALPLAGRRWEDFTLLTPAVTTDGNSGLTSFRGISGLYNGNSVDGANNTQAFFSEARGRAIIVTYVYSPDSVKEFEVSNSNYSAEYGQAAGGVVNAVTRSGTNQLHGDLFYDVRNQNWNALDPVSKAGGIFTKPVHQQNHFGGSVGAPIVKDKFFFFGTYDGFRKVNPILYTSTSTQAGIQAFTCPASAAAAACTAGKNFITTDLLGAFPRNLKQDVFLAKLDYQLNSANHLDVVFNWQNWGEPDGYNTSATVSNGGVTQNGQGGTHERFLIAHWTSTISANKVNEVRFAWGRDFEFDSTNSGGPAVSLTNITAYGETSALPRPAFPDEHRTQISDNLSWIKGAHAFKFGVDVNLIHEVLVNLFQGDGSYSYSTNTAFDGCNPTGSSNSLLQANAVFCRWLDDSVGANVHDGLTGQHYASFTQVNDPITHVGKDDFYDNDLGLFAEDSWKIRRNLTLNLGVRYDLQHVPAPPKPNTETSLLAFYTSTLNNDKNNIAPRIGVAWAATHNTVVRVGYGIFYGKTSNSTYYALRVENGIYQITYSGCGPGGATPALKACAPTFPNVFFQPPGPALAAPFAGALTPGVVIPGGTLPLAAQAVHGMSPNFVNPVAHEGEITVERQLPGHFAASATYLLTRGIHLPSSYDANIAPTTATRTYDVVNAAGATQQAVTVPWYQSRIDVNSGLILNQASVVNSWYNGLVLSLRKPMTRDLELLFNYTFSKALDDGETAGTNGTFFGTDDVTDPYNLHKDYSYSDLDQRHRFVGSAVWKPSYFHSSENKVVKGVADGWEASGILTRATGQPFTAMITGSTIAPVTGSGLVTSPDGGLDGAVVSTFASAANGRASWIPRNFYNLPSFTYIDFRMGRSFAIKEKYNLTVSADAFNLFNSTIVTAENTTAFAYAAPSATSATCPSSTHTNGCLVPSSSFKSRTTTTGLLYGARQLQINARFEF